MREITVSDAVSVEKAKEQVNRAGESGSPPRVRGKLWSDIVQHHEQLEKIRAIENFSDSDVTVEQGNTKKSVVVTDAVTVVNAMSKLYMTVTVA